MRVRLDAPTGHRNELPVENGACGECAEVEPGFELLSSTRTVEVLFDGSREAVPVPRHWLRRA